MEQQQQPMVGTCWKNVGMRTMFGLLLGVPGESMVSWQILLEHASQTGSVICGSEGIALMMT